MADKPKPYTARKGRGKMKNSIVIEVAKPEPIDNGVLDGIFNSSQAISDAVSKFWRLNLAKHATLGKVTNTQSGYEVEIIYKS